MVKILDKTASLKAIDYRHDAQMASNSSVSFLMNVTPTPYLCRCATRRQKLKNVMLWVDRAESKYADVSHTSHTIFVLVAHSSSLPFRNGSMFLRDQLFHLMVTSCYFVAWRESELPYRGDFHGMHLYLLFVPPKFRRRDSDTTQKRGRLLPPGSEPALSRPSWFQFVPIVPNVPIVRTGSSERGGNESPTLH